METLVKNYISAYNHFDIPGMLAQLTDDVVFENLANGEITTRTTSKMEFAELANQSAKLFSERNQSLTAATQDNDLFIVHVSYKAKLAQDLANGMKAGQSISLQGRSEFAFRDGKICLIRDIS
ncbi:nuclear transport factor 2 family protein [Pseudoalteromonas sp. DY56-GL79]|uniref:nuclear transport factor 2 family protein n=1 Tax=Pseudoalteromonas sp. DY56-GL79 TaxID=2967131 RepID=UPI00352B5D13